MERPCNFFSSEYTTLSKHNAPHFESILFHFLQLFLLVAFSIWSSSLHLLNSVNARQYRIVGKSGEVVTNELWRWILSTTALYTKTQSQ